MVFLLCSASVHSQLPYRFFLPRLEVFDLFTFPSLTNRTAAVYSPRIGKKRKRCRDKKIQGFASKEITIIAQRPISLEVEDAG